MEFRRVLFRSSRYPSTALTQKCQQNYNPRRRPEGPQGFAVATGESETVCSTAAQTRPSFPSTAETSALQTKRRRPAATTPPRGTSLSPQAGARKFTLYSTASGKAWGRG